MKKVLSFVCSALLLFSFSVPAFAQETELTASVPERHTVTIDSDNGRIVADGKVLDGGVEIERHKEQIYRIIPDPGKKLQSLTYNGEDVTGAIKSGVFTAPRLVRDATLTAVYTDAPPAPDDKEYSISGTVVDEDGNPLPGVAVDIGGKTDETDKDGRFKLGNIPSGTHMVVITDKEGKVIGCGEITIDKAEKDDLTLTVNENGNPIVKPRNDTKDIGLTIVVDNDGSIRIKDTKDITVHTGDGSSPATGDAAGLNLWFILMIASAGAISVILMANRRRKATEKS